jgi:hypothetical protein
MVTRATAQVMEAVEALRQGRIAARALVDMVFDTFEGGGAGRLVAWMALGGEAERLEPVNRAMRGLVAGIEAGSPFEPGEAHRRVSTAALLLTLTALGDALIGPTLHAAVDREPSAARDAIAALLEGLKPRP